MSGRGETGDEYRRDDPPVELAFGQTLYSEDGTPVGTVRGMEEEGVFVSMRDGVASMSIEHARSGQAFGEAELVWRCMTCGEMGYISGGLPDRCPNCRSGREELMYWTED